MKDDVYKIKDVDFSKFSLSKKVVSINGKALPLNIGDKIAMGKDDISIKTVMGITIHEDGRVAYILEWYDPNAGSFQSEGLTLSELKLLTDNMNTSKKKEQIGFSNEEK